MKEQFERIALVFGKEKVEKLHQARVAVFGVGGVGGFVVEALARSGVGAIDVIDKDVVDITNLNRQIIATHDTIGRKKTELIKERVLSINPDCKVTEHACFYLPETKDQFDFTQYDYVVDAIDTVTGKIALVLQAKEAGTKIISSMGAGNKIDPTRFEVADLSETSVCPLARVMRQELRKRGVTKLKVVYSKEPPRKTIPLEEKQAAEHEKNGGSFQKATPGSVAFVPSVVGLIIAGEIIKDLAGE